MADVVVEVETGRIDLTPYYMAKMAGDVYRAARQYETDNKMPRYRFFLYSVSIELGMKSALLNNNNTKSQKSMNKDISHNLRKLCAAADSILGADFFEDFERPQYTKFPRFSREIRPSNTLHPISSKKW